MIYISLDPGKTTGVCKYTIEPDHGDLTNLRSYFEMFQITKDAVGLGHWLDQQDIKGLIYESFQYRRIPNADLTAVEIIGTIKFWCSSRGVRIKPVAQPPSSKSLWDKKKLERIGLYEPNAPHANDATSHMLYYISSLPSNSKLRKTVTDLTFQSIMKVRNEILEKVKPI
jgi:hypothetical protein|tara:strand:+ start:16093 stop:16602 length:510 start_codon:yes stop_codon:yes gene_type:complete